MPELKYIERVNTVLKPRAHLNPRIVIDLFAGCGGLALGFEALGFKTIGFEVDKDCCETYNKNLGRECVQSFLNDKSDFPAADVVIGGPPCQPFSLRGKQRGHADERNGFPAFISAVKKVQPKLWIFENVKGLLFKNKEYLNHVIESLKGLGCSVDLHLVNAVDYGVPQNRERIIVIGYQTGEFIFPEKSNVKMTAGDALGKMALAAPRGSRYLTASMDAYIAKYEKASMCRVPRDLHLHLPARTLTCRNLSGATSDMQRIRLPNGKRRRLLSREAARLQSFPDWFEFCGNESSIFNQIGNAVPPLLSYQLAGAVMRYMEMHGDKTVVKSNESDRKWKYAYQQKMILHALTAELGINRSKVYEEV